jgi:hypothetical protein
MKKEISKEFLEIYKNRVETFRSELNHLKDLLSLRLKQLKRTGGTRARLVDARVKKPAKIWKKAVKYNYSVPKALNKIVDVLGIQIVCNNLSDTESVIKMIKQESGYIHIKKIVDMVTNPREDGYPLEDSEWVVYSAMVAAEVATESGIEAVKDRIEKEWDEITTFALGESLPQTIEDFIDELENVTSYRTKDTEDQADEIKSYFSLLGCISEDIYGMKELDTICAVEAIVEYYGADVDEERLTELIDLFVQAYG